MESLENESFEYHTYSWKLKPLYHIFISSQFYNLKYRILTKIQSFPFLFSFSPQWGSFLHHIFRHISACFRRLKAIWGLFYSHYFKSVDYIFFPEVSKDIMLYECLFLNSAFVFGFHIKTYMKTYIIYINPLAVNAIVSNFLSYLGLWAACYKFSIQMMYWIVCQVVAHTIWVRWLILNAS